MNERSGKVFYMGASQNTLNKIENKVHTEFPNIKVRSYSPPFKPIFSKEDNETMIAQINEFVPDVLFIGMTAPKQEKLLYEHMEELEFTVASSIGAVFDFYAGTVEHPS